MVKLINKEEFKKLYPDVDLDLDSHVTDGGMMHSLDMDDSIHAAAHYYGAAGAAACNEMLRSYRHAKFANLNARINSSINEARKKECEEIPDDFKINFLEGKIEELKNLNDEFEDTIREQARELKDLKSQSWFTRFKSLFKSYNPF